MAENTARYGKQMLVGCIGRDGQQKIIATRVLVIGAGGTGSSALFYLASSGFSIGIADGDVVSLDNLNRQIVHTEERVGTNKAESAAKTLSALNSGIDIEVHRVFFDPKNALALAEKYDVLVDCTDDMATRYLISDVAKILGKRVVMASALRTEGQILFLACNGPCYRCIFPTYKKELTSCDQNGIIGGICGAVGALQSFVLIRAVLSDEPSYMVVLDGKKLEMCKYPLRERRTDCMCRSDMRSLLASDIYACINPTSCSTRERLRWSEYLENTHKYTLIDVREHILPGKTRGLHFPLSRIRNGENPPIDKNTRALLFCQKGISSWMGADILRERGINAMDIIGGVSSSESIKKL